MPDVTVPEGMKTSGRFHLDAGQVSTVTFAENIGRARVISDGTAAVYVTFDGDEPTIDGANTFELPANVAYLREEDTTNTPDGDVVKLISDGTPSVRVEVA